MKTVTYLTAAVFWLMASLVVIVFHHGVALRTQIGITRQNVRFLHYYI